MNEEQKFNEVNELIEELEVSKKVSEVKNNMKTLEIYWNIGRLIVETQGGVRAKYGDNLIKKWGKKLAEKYGTEYGVRNVKYYRQFYMEFKIVHAVRAQLTWTHYKSLLPLKNENERNYYTNQVILNSLTTRELDDIDPMLLLMN